MTPGLINSPYLIYL